MYTPWNPGETRWNTLVEASRGILLPHGRTGGELVASALPLGSETAMRSVTFWRWSFGRKS